MVLLTDVYRNLTSLWIKPRERAFKQFKSPVLNVLTGLLKTQSVVQGIMDFLREYSSLTQISSSWSAVSVWSYLLSCNKKAIGVRLEYFHHKNNRKCRGSILLRYYALSMGSQIPMFRGHCIVESTAVPLCKPHSSWQKSFLTFVVDNPVSIETC
jgi:hypothetical protein